MDKEGTHVVMLSTNLEFTVWDVDSVLALARVTLEDESFFVCVEWVPDYLVFSVEWVLFECFEVALTPSGFLGFIPDEVRFIKYVLCILLFNFLLFLYNLFLLHFLALFC